MISSADIHHARVLIVDDQHPNVLLLDRMLRSAGYTFIASTMDPHEVCELHRKNRYDLILLDLVMPGMDGFQVMEGLQEIEKDGYLPVLVITAEPEHKLRALTAGAKDFISKPFDLAEVLTRVYNMLEVRKIHDELELRVQERSGELIRANEQLLKKIEEREATEASLRSAYAEIQQLSETEDRIERTAKLVAQCTLDRSPP